MVENPSPRPPTASFKLIAVASVVGVCAALAGFGMFYGRLTGGSAEGAVSRLKLEDIPFNGQRAYDDLKRICSLGRRTSGTPGMEAQQKLLTEHFTRLGAQVRLQRFLGRHPVDGTPVPMANLIVQWHPESKERVLFCTHYDTLPYPTRTLAGSKDMFTMDRSARFLGANDGGSGVALLMELGREMPDLETRYGVDFVMFDAEEFIFSPEHPYFLGSEYFAQDYANSPPPYRYRWGVLLDMIGGKDLQLYQERNSMAWRDTRGLVEDIWATARRLGVREFIARKKHEVRDDHLPLHNTGGIPTCDIIDFDYPAWHTPQDTPERCSALSLAKVGWVLREWLKALK